MKSFREQNFYELLELARTASDEEIRAAHSRLTDQFSDDAVALYGLADPADAKDLRARLLEAMEILTDANLRIEYDRSIGLPPLPPPAAPAKPADEEPAQSRQLAMNELLFNVEAMHSTFPQYQVSYIPHSPAQVGTPVSRVDAPPEASVPSAEAAVAAAAPKVEAAPEASADAAVAPTAPGSKAEASPASSGPGADAPAATTGPGTSAEASPAAPTGPGTDGAAAGSTSQASPAAVGAGPGTESPTPPAAPLPPSSPAVPGPGRSTARAVEVSPELGPEIAIASAEAALAQVSAKVREARAPPPAPIPTPPPMPPPPTEARPKPIEIPADAEFNGELLRQVRQSRGMSLEQLAERTRITARHLGNIEADRYDALPVTVYLRGILMNVSRELGLDPLRVAKSYLGLVSAGRKA